MNKRTTVMIPAELRSRADRVARERGVSLAELVRDALELALREERAEDRPRDSVFERVLRAPGAKKAPRDGARDHDKYLYEEKP